MGETFDIHWGVLQVAGTLWVLAGIASFVMLLIVMRRSRTPDQDLIPEVHGETNYITGFIITLIAGPIPLLLLALDWREARRRR